MTTFFAAAPTVGFVLLAAALVGAPLGLAALARRDRRRAATAVEWGAPLEDIVPTVDPLDTAVPVEPYDLAEPSLFDELTALHPVRLDWAPPSFTQEWHAIGQQMRELGETQRIEKVAA